MEQKNREKNLKERIRSGHIRREDVTRRLAELAFGKANDCVRLALEDEPDLKRLDLSLLSEVKRNEKGTVEIKLIDRLKALEQLAQGEKGRKRILYSGGGFVIMKNKKGGGKVKRKLLRFGAAIALLALLGGVTALCINGYVVASTKGQILTPEEAASLTGVDCILVLGCRVYDDGTPSAMLHDRLRQGVELYQAGAAPKLLMSGDHGQTDYDEVNVMKQFAVEAGIASSDVFMDHAGFSTYESVYRAKEIFGVEKVIIVTQHYHLHRALYIARRLGLEAYGVAADYRSYAGQFMREIREILARNKDFFTAIFLPEPTYLGEKIPVSGDGDITSG